MTSSFTTSNQLQRLAWSMRIPLAGVYWRNRLPRRLHNKCAYIVNMAADTDDGIGTHWVAIALDDNGFAYYFDSFGAPAPVEVVEALNGRRLFQSDQIIQNMRGGRCGLYCLMFLAAAFDRLPSLSAATMAIRIDRYRAVFSGDVEKNMKRLLNLYKAMREDGKELEPEQEWEG